MTQLLKNRRFWLSAIAIVGLLAVALWPETIPVDVVTAARDTVTVTVDEEGRTRVRERYVVSAPVSARILRLELEPGDRVRRGDVVARLRPMMSPLLDPRSSSEADAALAAARATLGRAEAEKARAAAALAHAERELTRTRRLTAAGVLPQQQLEAQEADVALAGEAVRAATYAVGAADADVVRAEARLAAPAAVADAAVVVVRAPADGVVLRRLRESEAVVPPGEPLLEIGDPADLEVVVDLLSTDAARLRPGTRAAVEPWHGRPPLEATISRIEPAGFTKVSALGVEEQRVNVILAVAQQGDEDTTLGDGYRVEARIVVDEVRDAVTVPTSAVFRHGESWAVFALVDGRARLTPVIVAAQSARTAAIASGLRVGTTVIVHPGDEIADGSRAAVRQEE